MAYESENTVSMSIDMPQSPALGAFPGSPTHVAAPMSDLNSFSMNAASHQTAFLTIEKKTPVGVVVAGVALTLVCLVAYVASSSAQLDQFLQLLGLVEPPVPVYVSHKSNHAPIVPVELAAPVETRASVLPSIWTEVENMEGTGTVNIGPALSIGELQKFNQGMTSPFNYQHYQAVVDLGKRLPAGSHGVFQGAIQTEKFWTRMRAVIALADLGGDIRRSDIEMALGDTSGELRARFFKRFEKSPCSIGCYFVARASIQHLDSEGRAQLLRVISREPSKIRDRFMVAGTFDESEEVRQTAIEWLDGHHVDPKIWGEMNRKRGLKVVEAVSPIFDSKRAQGLTEAESELSAMENAETGTDASTAAPESNAEGAK